MAFFICTLVDDNMFCSLACLIFSTLLFLFSSVSSLLAASSLSVAANLFYFLDRAKSLREFKWLWMKVDECKLVLSSLLSIASVTLFSSLRASESYMLSIQSLILSLFLSYFNVYSSESSDIACLLINYTDASFRRLANILVCRSPIALSRCWRDDLRDSVLDPVFGGWSTSCKLS